MRIYSPVVELKPLLDIPNDQPADLLHEAVAKLLDYHPQGSLADDPHLFGPLLQRASVDEEFRFSLALGYGNLSFIAEDNGSSFKIRDCPEWLLKNCLNRTLCKGIIRRAIAKGITEV